MSPPPPIGNSLHSTQQIERKLASEVNHVSITPQGMLAIFMLACTHLLALVSARARRVWSYWRILSPRALFVHMHI